MARLSVLFLVSAFFGALIGLVGRAQMTPVQGDDLLGVFLGFIALGAALMLAAATLPKDGDVRAGAMPSAA